MNGDKENSVILEIIGEYGRIDRKWLKLHYGTFIGLVIFSFLVECVLGPILYFLGYSSIPLHSYLLKYIAAPFTVNLLLIAAGHIVMRSRSLKQIVKVYTVSLLFVAACFVLSAVHNMFDTLYFVFAVPVLMTVVYGDYALTTAVFAVGTAAKLTAELFVKWDPDIPSPLQNGMDTINLIIATCILLAFYFACIIVIRFEREKNTASIEKEIERFKMRRKLITDELTQVYNRTALRSAFQDMEEDDKPGIYVLAMMDMDNFKTLNDTLGHQKGDENLREFGAILKNSCGNALPVRFGGDEFCVLFKNVSAQEAANICAGVQRRLKEHSMAKYGIPVSVSVGIAAYKRRMPASQLIRNSDAALYKAKESRGSIYIFEE